MAFDISTAKPEQIGFDISTAKPEGQQQPKKKSFFSALGGTTADEITPEIQKKHPILSGMVKAGQEAISIPSDFLNQRLLNYPRAALNKAGVEWPESRTEAGQKIQKAGGMAGAAMSGAGLAAKMGLAKAGQGAGATALKSGALGAAYADTERPFDPMQKAQQFGAAALTSGVFSAASKANQSLDKAKGTEFLRKVRGAVFSRKREVVDKFSDDLDNLANAKPDQAVSIRTSLEKLGVEINGGQFGDVIIPPNPKIASIVNRSPTLKKFIDNPDLADSVPLRESQAIINELKNKLPEMKKNGFNVTSDDIPLFDLIDDMRYDQLIAFPEMAQVRQQYGQMMSKYNLIKYKIREGALKKQLINDFGDPELKEAFDGLISQDIMKEVKGYKQTNQVLKIMGIAAKTAGAGAIGGLGAKVGYDLLNR